MDICVNRILPCSFIDGPGSRMAIFLQSCNMACLYCHNPETQQNCCHCGLCLPVCPAAALTQQEGRIVHDPEKCLGCDACLAACPHFSSPKAQAIPLTLLLERIKRAAPFLSGITVSGGECTLQTIALVQLFKELHRQTNLTAFVDTNGLLPPDDLAALLAVSDGFCFDLKAFDNALHQKLTGVSNQPVKENLRRTAQAGKLYEVRTVLIEGYTASTQEIDALGAWLAALPGSFHWKLIPFRPQGVRGELRQLAPFSNERYQELLSVARSRLGTRVTTSL